MLFSTFGLANEEVDSLIHQINISSGIKKIDAELKLSFYYRRLNTSKARKLAKMALDKLQTQYNNSEMEAEAIYCLGISYYYDSDYQNALDHLYRSVTLSQENHNDHMLSALYYFIGSSHYFYYGDNVKIISYYNQSIYYGISSNNNRILGATYSALSNLFRVSGSYEKSLEFIYKSREHYAKANYREGIAWIDYTTGSLYKTMGLLEEAKVTFTRSMEIYRELSAIDTIMTGVAICMDQLAVINMELGNDKLARKYNLAAYDYYKQDNSSYGISNSLKYLADIEIKAGNYTRAESLLDSSLSIKRDIHNMVGFASIYSLYGALFIEQHNYQRALDSLAKGLNHATNNKQMKYLIEINKYMAEAYKNIGQYEKAFEYKSKEVCIADSIYSAKATKSILQLETLFEIENREEMIDQLEKDKLKNELSLTHQKTFQQYLIVMIILAIIIITMFIYFYRSKVHANIELRKSKKLVEEMNITKDKFFSILAHDLRSPFNSILGLSNILKQKHMNMGVDERDKIIQAIYKSSNNNYALLNNLLEWSRSQRGKISFIPEPLIINELVEKTKALHASVADSKGIKIIIDPEPITINADKNMINTVLRNLISNSIKYSKHGDKIHIKFSKSNFETRISVSDTGIGMNEIDQQRLFEIGNNFQIKGTAGEKGTGLGLIICKEFIDMHHGKIWVDSEPGKGSTFHFTIPDVI